MPTKSALERHAALVDRMANRLGVDLEQAMMEGRLTQGQLDDAVLSCTGCSHPDTCEHWLDLFEDGSDSTASGYCRNGEIIANLAKGKHA